MIGLVFTPEQFKTLLRMIYIANTVVNGQREEEDIQKEYDELEQYIFSRAKEAGLPAAVSHHKVGDEEHHHPSRLFENDTEMNAIMDLYDLRIALDVLSEKLAERDIEKKYGPRAKDRMPAKDYEDLLFEAAKGYSEVFLADGFSSISIQGKEA